MKTKDAVILERLDFKIEASINLGSDVVTCEVHSGDLSFEQAMDCMIQLRDHLSVRIEAAAKECPFSPKTIL